MAEEEIVFRLLLDGDGGNVVEPLLLGLLSMADRAVEALDVDAGGAGALPDPDGDVLLAAALGLVSWRRSLRAWYASASRDDRSAGEDGPSPGRLEDPLR